MNSIRAMYEFVFYFIYRRQLVESKGKIAPAKQVAFVLLILAILIQIMFFYALARFCLYNGFKISIAFKFGRTYSLPKTAGVLAVAWPFYYFINKHFTNERIDQITEYYNQRYPYFYTFLNFIKYFAAYLIPLLVSIFLVDHSIVGQ
jgi:hypothetical protein